MKTRLGNSLLLTLLVLLATRQAVAQETIKIGVVTSLTGSLASIGLMTDNAIELYMRQQNQSIDGKRVEVIPRDVYAPDDAKRVVQELIVRDKVDVIVGFSLAAQLFAVADLVREAKKPAIISNVTRSDVLSRSPYFIRTSVALPQVLGELGRWSAQNTPKRAFLVVTEDESNAAFAVAFEKSGGQIVGASQITPATTDFSTIASQIGRENPGTVFISATGVDQFGKLTASLTANGLSASTTILTSGEFTDPTALSVLGSNAAGLVNGWYYNPRHASAMNSDFVKNMRTLLNGREPDSAAVGAYDAMHLIFQAISKTNGKTDGEALLAAMKGMAWESPRGPVSIDPDTREMMQNVYIGKVTKSGDQLYNAELATFPGIRPPASIQEPPVCCTSRTCTDMKICNRTQQ